MTGRRSYLLQDDSKGQQEHGGIPTLPPMLRLTLLPGRSSLRVDEAEEEGVPLSQIGAMSVVEYRDRFIELSRYAPEEVVDDPKKQERFIEGFAGPLWYQLTSHTFPSFQHLLDKAITLESMCRDLGELKRKAATPGQSGSNTRPRLTSPLGVPFRPGGPTRGYGQQQQSQYQPQ
jgi:hypothetical protein